MFKRILSSFVIWMFALDAVVSCEKPKDLWLDLTVAIRKGELSIFDCFGRFVDLDSHDPLDIWEKTPLHIAVEFNQMAIAKSLLERGANVNSINAIDEMPLKLAVKKGWNDMSAFLVFNGADVENPDSLGRSILFWAISKENVSMIKLLIDHNANLMQDVHVSDQLISLQDYASQKGNKLINELLINGVKK